MLEHKYFKDNCCCVFPYDWITENYFANGYAVSNMGCCLTGQYLLGVCLCLGNFQTGCCLMGNRQKGCCLMGDDLEGVCLCGNHKKGRCLLQDDTKGYLCFHTPYPNPSAMLTRGHKDPPNFLGHATVNPIVEQSL